MIKNLLIMLRIKANLTRCCLITYMIYEKSSRKDFSNQMNLLNSNVLTIFRKT